MIEIKTIVSWDTDSFDAELEEHLNDGWSIQNKYVQVIEELICFVWTLQRTAQKGKASQD